MLGLQEGELLGLQLGDLLGLQLGELLGLQLGELLGLQLGELLGLQLGELLGLQLGELLGLQLGELLGELLGLQLGDTEGEGDQLGDPPGLPLLPPLHWPHVFWQNLPAVIHDWLQALKSFCAHARPKKTPSPPCSASKLATK